MFHDEAGLIDELVETLHVRSPIGDRAGGNTTFHRRARHRRCDFRDQARIERFGDQIILAESGSGFTVCHRHDVGLLGLGKFGNGIYRRELHRFIDRRRTDIERTAKDERKTKHIVHLVGIVGTTGRNHRIVAHRADFFRQDFRCWIGQCEDQRLIRHAFDHLGFQNTACG